MRQIRYLQLTGIGLAWFALVSSEANAQQTAVWKTGPALQRQLESTVSVAGTPRPLREALASLSQSASVAVFLDRRIDPGQPIDLTVRKQPLQLVLEQMAKQGNASVAITGSVVYVGPPETAAKLATLAATRRQDATKLSNDAKARLLAARSWQWSELAEPRQLLEDLARQARVQVENPSTVPHDLWPAVSLPSLPWVDRLTLFLVGFDLTFEIAGEAASIKLIPIPEAVALEKSYTPRGFSVDTAAQLRRIVPEAKIRVEGPKLVAVGSFDDHEKIERLLSGQSVRTTQKSPVGEGEKRYSLQPAKGTAGAVLATVAKQIGKELKYDAAVLPKLKQEVEFSVKEVTLDELLTRTLKPLGLTYKLTDYAIEVLPAE